ncbi:uncharacterized protein At1g51745-like [Andrographis paniculata]|uniref:uncharacterized protein At1g51745-like n=1 Tax=Andrographis paniculata TaxID=175694 RepID=UPI0021E8252F|nr:uncharacterized protein At1g51745-like [Andrographis paniculata]XP_051119060.1 uncharacterized protein At1g51745-like [Andrographis paniculata]
MVSSEEDPNKGIDASVGGLVWVRRRNGSWWPGRILSPDELPEGCVPTPKAGTPVKLLGREDASVDWYNLEKSKRIKPFHCGEYEDCIKKAKSGASQLLKKGVKYARREDAILHALEIENARLQKDLPDLSGTPDTKNSEQQNRADEPSVLNPSKENKDVDKGNSSGDGSDSAQERSQSGVSFEEPERAVVDDKEPKQRKTPNDSEDDGPGGAKRMKGLQDLGMGAALPAKRKRSQVAHVHEFLKKKNRRRTMTKVLESTTALPVPAANEQPSSPVEPSAQIASDNNKTSELESYESKNSNSVLVNNNSDSNGTSCEDATPLDAAGTKQKDAEQSAGTKIPSLSNASKKAPIGAKNESSRSSRVEEHNESGSTSSGAANIPQISTDKPEKGASDWQIKGKRNSRSRKVDIDNEAETNLPGADEDPKPAKSRPITEIQLGWNRSSPKETQSAPPRMLPYRQSRFTVNPKYEASEFSLSHHIAGPNIYEVTITVKTEYKPQHVPYISLMSKFNSDPIVGHPLTVEAVDEDFCNDLISAGNSKLELDDPGEGKEASKGGGKSKKVKSGRGKRNRKQGSRGQSGKAPRKSVAAMSKKIRKLSSLTGSQRMSKELQKRKKKKAGEGAEKMRGPSVACVPLTVVFSRINAALA